MTDTSTDTDAATSNDGSDNTTTNAIIWTTAKAPSSKKIYPVAVVRAAVDDSLAERSKSANGLQYQTMRLLCSKRNPMAVVAAAHDEIPVERSKGAN